MEPIPYQLARVAFDELLASEGYVLHFSEYNGPSFGSAYAVYRANGRPWYQLIWDGKDGCLAVEISRDGKNYTEVCHTPMGLESAAAELVNESITRLVERSKLAISEK